MRKKAFRTAEDDILDERDKLMPVMARHQSTVKPDGTINECHYLVGQDGSILTTYLPEPTVIYMADAMNTQYLLEKYNRSGLGWRACGQVKIVSDGMLLDDRQVVRMSADGTPKILPSPAYQLSINEAKRSALQNVYMYTMKLPVIKEVAMSCRFTFNLLASPKQMASMVQWVIDVLVSAGIVRRAELITGLYDTVINQESGAEASVMVEFSRRGTKINE